MDIVEAMRTRKSIRGYKPIPVPKDTLTEILDLAKLAPSALNQQPWEFVVLMGESLEKAKEINAECTASGAKPSSDLLLGDSYQQTATHRERQVTLGKEMFRLMDIARDDQAKRMQWVIRGMRFFDAPAVILLCLDEMVFNSANQMALLDIGIITQSIALIALEYGLGTCIQGAPVIYASNLKKALDIPEPKRLVLSLAIGYPDWDYPANQIQTERASLDTIVTWKT